MATSVFPTVSSWIQMRSKTFWERKFALAYIHNPGYISMLNCVIWQASYRVCMCVYSYILKAVMKYEIISRGKTNQEAFPPSRVFKHIHKAFSDCIEAKNQLPKFQTALAFKGRYAHFSPPMKKTKNRHNYSENDMRELNGWKIV